MPTDPIVPIKSRPAKSDVPIFISLCLPSLCCDQPVEQRPYQLKQASAERQRNDRLTLCGGDKEERLSEVALPKHRLQCPDSLSTRCQIADSWPGRRFAASNYH
jgi:hypothetical protein